MLGTCISHMLIKRSFQRSDIVDLFTLCRMPFPDKEQVDTKMMAGIDFAKRQTTICRKWQCV